MPGSSKLRLVRRHAAFLAVVALMLAYAWPMQGFGYNQTSHYILVKALADHTAVVDQALGEVGDLGTQDITRVGDHLYSNKAPGLAGLTLPTFLVLKAAGARTVGDPTQMLWALGLIGTVLPATALVLLVRRVAGSVEPGFGTVAAIAMGFGTLLLPFATMFFAHALSAVPRRSRRSPFCSSSGEDDRALGSSPRRASSPAWRSRPSTRPR